MCRNCPPAPRRRWMTCCPLWRPERRPMRMRCPLRLPFLSDADINAAIHGKVDVVDGQGGGFVFLGTHAGSAAFAACELLAGGVAALVFQREVQAVAVGLKACIVERLLKGACIALQEIK